MAHLLGIQRAEIAVRLEKVWRELMEIKAECLRYASPGVACYTRAANAINEASADVSAAQAAMLTMGV